MVLPKNAKLSKLSMNKTLMKLRHDLTGLDFTNFCIFEVKV